MCVSGGEHTLPTAMWLLSRSWEGPATGLGPWVQRCLGLFWVKCSQKAKAIYGRCLLLIISRVDYGEAENLTGRDQLKLDWIREEWAGIVGLHGDRVWAEMALCNGLSVCLHFHFLVISQWPWPTLVFCEIRPNRRFRATSPRPTSEKTQGWLYLKKVSLCISKPAVFFLRKQLFDS